MPNPFLPVISSLLPEPHASLLSGILFGVKTSLPKDTYRALVNTGTVHIIALSGMNISILACLVAQSTLFLGRKASSIFSISLIVLFVLFVGPSPTVVRAAIMGSLALLATYFGRLNWGLLNLFLAGLIMLLLDFSLLGNISFQLSFLATLGLILVGQNKKRLSLKGLANQLIGYFKDNLKLTLAAQLFTLPVILINFRQLSLVAPVANLLIEWAIQPVMVLGFLTAILGWLFKPLGILPAWGTWVLLSYIIKVLEIVAKLPGVNISF